MIELEPRPCKVGKQLIERMNQHVTKQVGNIIGNQDPALRCKVGIGINEGHDLFMTSISGIPF